MVEDLLAELESGVQGKDVAVENVDDALQCCLDELLIGLVP